MMCCVYRTDHILFATHIFFFILGFKDLVGLSGPVAEWNQLNTSAHTLKHLRPSLSQCLVCLSRTAVETRRSANMVVLKARASFVAEMFFFKLKKIYQKISKKLHPPRQFPALL